jgi:hypothetical protein
VYRKLSALSLSLFLFACTTNHADEAAPDPSPNADWIKIEASSTRIPVNEYSIAKLKAVTDQGVNVTEGTVFYVNGEKLDGHSFSPSSTGVYSVKGIYRDLESPEINITAEIPRNKKVLIESFTSRTCGWCPWIGKRVDSLHHANEKVIGYSIHGQDQLALAEAPDFEEYLSVYSRPAIRINRGYVRNYAAPTEIQGLLDSVSFFLSTQPDVELAIQSNLQNQTLNVKVLGRFFENIYTDLYLTLLIVEDDIVTNNQFNYFSGAPYEACPYTEEPNPIPTYKNHHVLRQFLTNSKGNAIDMSTIEPGQERELGTFQTPVYNPIKPENSFIIALLHEQVQSIEFSSVLNAQIVKMGEDVGFEE